MEYRHSILEWMDLDGRSDGRVNGGRIGTILSPIRPKEPLLTEPEGTQKGLKSNNGEAVVSPEGLEILKKELLKLGSGIEITVTYKPQLQEHYNGKTLTEITLTEMEKVQKRNRDMKYILVGEYSKTGIYHMHGILLTSSRGVNGVRRRLQRELGRTELKAIKYLDSYVNYILKDDDNGKRVITTDEVIMKL